MVKYYSVADLPIWKINIVTSVLSEYGVVGTVTGTQLALDGPGISIARGLTVAEQKASLLEPMATRWVSTTL